MSATLAASSPIQALSGLPIQGYHVVSITAGGTRIKDSVVTPDLPGAHARAQVHAALVMGTTYEVHYPAPQSHDPNGLY